MPEPRPAVLVVDDDPELGRLICEILDENGFMADDVGSPTEAIKRAGAKPFAVAVVDFVMPGMNGLDAADRIRMADPDTQIVMLTAHASVEVAIEMMNRSVFGLIPKIDLDRGLLLRSVTRAAEQARVLTPRGGAPGFPAEADT